MNAFRENIEFLIIQKLAGTASEEELQLLDQLIKDDPEVATLWEIAMQKNDREDINNQFTRIEGWDWADIKTLKNTAQQRKRKKVITFISAITAAAVIILVVITVFVKNKPSVPVLNNLTAVNVKSIELKLPDGQVINLSEQSGNIRTQTITLINKNKTLSFDANSKITGLNKLVVPIGKDFHVTLSDGTEVWMNSATTLQFPFSFKGSTREIYIDGEAFIQVTKNAAKPLLVHTPTGTVKVLGTSFNVNCYDRNILAVSLVEGSIQLMTMDNKTQLKPGLKAISQNGKVDIKPFDEDIVLAWREGKYYFDNASFAEIMQILPRWYGIEVEFDDKAVSNQHFTGMINRNKPLTAFLEKLKIAMQIDYYFDKAGNLHIK